VGVSHLKLGTPVPSSAATTDEAYQSTVFIAACLASFIRCGELKETIFPAAAPYTNKVVGAQSTARRRLLQSGSDADVPNNGDFDASGAATFVMLDSAEYHLQSTPNDRIEFYEDFRLSLRMRLSNASGAEYGDGLVLSNRPSDDGGSSSSSSSSGAPHDMRVEVVGGGHVRLHLCGVEHVTDALVPGEWNEFSFVVKTQSVLTILHNSEAMLVEHFMFGETSTGDPCYVDNTKITVGASSGEPSAVGVDLQFAILNEDILVRDKSVFLDGVLVTDVSSLPSAAANFSKPVWNADVLKEVRSRLARNIKEEFNFAPVATNVSVLADGNAAFYVRIYAHEDALLHFNLQTFVDRLNTEFVAYRIPPVTLQGGGEALAQDIVPGLSLTYWSVPPLICGEFHALCVYDELALAAHSVSVDGRVVLNDAATAAFDFHALETFSIGPDVLRSHVSAPGGDDAVQRYWGGGFDCSLDFLLRTRSDKDGDDIHLEISYPTSQNFDIVLIFKGADADVETDGDELIQVWLGAGRRTPLMDPEEEPLLITASAGLQHIRVTIDASAYFRMWVEGEQVGPPIYITHPPFFDPHVARGVTFFSPPLHFLDGVRELSAVHFASNRLDSCTCQSTCTEHHYADPSVEGECLPCPDHTQTLMRNATSIDQCVCASQFSRKIPDDPESCSYDEPVVVYSYEPVQDKKRKHCRPAVGNLEGECRIVDLLSSATDELDCSCADSCLTAQPGLGELLCCRNKCTVCPGASPQCDCVWDAVGQIAFNNASGTGGALCDGYMCAVGERVQAGRCVPCEKNSYQSETTGTAECMPCLACDAGYFRVGCGLGQQGACERCTECEVGFQVKEQCGGISDTVCVDPGDCSDRASLAECGVGEYYAACDESSAQTGRCERCPIQEATDCPSGFFLNFLCGVLGEDTPVVPNQCLPCNRAICPQESELYFPSPGVCGIPAEPGTMMEATMECTQTCNSPQPDEWLQKLCQFKRPTNT